MSSDGLRHARFGRKNWFLLPQTTHALYSLWFFSFALKFTLGLHSQLLTLDPNPDHWPLPLILDPNTWSFTLTLDPYLRPSPLTLNPYPWPATHVLVMPLILFVESCFCKTVSNGSQNRSRQPLCRQRSLHIFRPNGR